MKNFCLPIVVSFTVISLILMGTSRFVRLGESDLVQNSRDQKKFSLRVVMISSSVAQSKHEWLLVISIQGFLTTFRTARNIMLSLTVLYHCEIHDINGEDYNVAPSIHRRISTATSRFQEIFSDIQIKCMVNFGSSYCQSVFAGFEDFYLFLEHDWLFLPSQIGHNIHSILSLLHRSDEVGSIRFSQFKDLKTLEPCNRDAKNFGDDLWLVKSSKYSNNPHIITKKHAQSLSEMYCSMSQPLDYGHTKFELQMIAYCLENDVDIFNISPQTINCSQLESNKSTCKLFLYSRGSNSQTVYHLDGANLLHNNATSSGVLFKGENRLLLEKFLSNTISGDEYIYFLDGFIIDGTADSVSG